MKISNTVKSLQNRLPVVCVLMSTYNGEKFLREQLDSILVQKAVSLKFLVRDDGSSDKTLDILKEYADKFCNFAYYNGQNLGVAQSFLDTIKNAPDAEYYAFADQDDVWDNDKLQVAIEKIQQLDNSRPALYYSNLRIVDSNLNFISISHSRPHTTNNKYSAMVESLPTGCTMLFNKVAKDMIVGRVPKYCSMHDTWIYMICKLFGNTIYDYTAHILYRQHGNNVIGAYTEKTILAYYKRLKIAFNRNFQPVYNNAKSFMECYGNMLCNDDRQKVMKIVNYKHSFVEQLSLLFDFKLRASSLRRDIKNRIRIVLKTL